MEQARAMNDAPGGEKMTANQATNVVLLRPTKPNYLKPDFDQIPDDLKKVPNWVEWRGEAPKPGKAKWRKVPYIAQAGKPMAASATDPATWRSFEEAVQAYQSSQKHARPFDGIGFVFDGEVGEDGLCYCGIDLDAWTDKAQAIFAKLATYTEISPSGNGVHAISRAAPFKQETCKTDALSAEAYCAGRYFTFSGRLVEGSVETIEARAHEIVEVVAEIEGVSASARAKPASGRKSYLAQLRDIKSQPQKIRISERFANVPLESLCGPGEPLNMEKFKSALWGLADGWLADEGHWKTICLICANEAMRNGGGHTTLKQALWEALDERSRGVEGYDQADNRRHFDRFIAGYGNVMSPILAGSLYQEAERQDWTWTPPSDPDAAATLGTQAPGSQSGPQSGLQSGGTGPQIKPLKGRSSYAQARNLLAALPFAFSYDELHDRCFYDGEPLSDALVARLREYCIDASEDHRDPSFKTTREAAEALCDKNRFDPEKDWLNGLIWDGVPRIDRLLIDYCGVEDTPLARAAGRKMMVGKALRALYPGCLHDWALVLEGSQGCGKTSFARVLAGSPDRIIDVAIMHEKPQVQQEMLRGRTVQEIAEMADMKRADTNSIKTYMSRPFDPARGAYAHSPKDQPRHCVYIGTTNDAQYLPDEDNRRFYPFKVGVIDLAALMRDRDQLHAEAVEAVRRGEDAVVPRNLWAAAAKEQKKRRIEDPWEDVIGEAIRSEIAQNAKHSAAVARNTGAKGIRVGEFPSSHVREIAHKGGRVWFIVSAAVLTNILEIDVAQQHGSAGRRARAVMGRLGWEAAQVKIDGIVRRGFIYNLAAKGIAAGEWDRYKDALDDDEAATPGEGAIAGRSSNSASHHETVRDNPETAQETTDAAKRSGSDGRPARGRWIMRSADDDDGVQAALARGDEIIELFDDRDDDAGWVEWTQGLKIK
jgi:putative DNA primase/helicase